ncbi:Hydrolase [Burkholderia sp. 8Y]|uniref:lecithin retinol acyltransferase family protein n=1 Tax=Burkholderia sp. 8Y TaxID=2653133 RepID=UPI0012F0A022|nr:lecithin retinol acyltransferase family protein [Burkholderia sp. 8Y]VXC74765.1 Hydrolase [Burkholderia sp. 8Y]
MSSKQATSRSDESAAARGFSFDDEPPLGSELVTRRCGYEHHGIYAGNGTVIHYAGFAKSLHRGPVEEVSIAQFADGHDLIVRLHPAAAFVGLEAVRRAHSRLGENRYRLLTNNCEHFVSWCLFGEARSTQVRACLIDPRAAMHAVRGLFSAYIAAQRRRRASALIGCGAPSVAFAI